MRRLGRFLKALATALEPALTWLRPVVAVLAALPTVVAALLGNLWLAVTVLLATLLVALLVGSFRAWSAADTRARRYDGDTELQRGLADLLREGREVRRRIATAGLPNLVEGDLFSWAWNTQEFLRMVPAEEMLEEWGPLEGMDTGSGDQFALKLGATAGAIPREALLDYMDRGIRMLVGFQRRLQD
jgi:hypothetical protein